jgi:hypothetical protein
MVLVLRQGGVPGVSEPTAQRWSVPDNHNALQHLRNSNTAALDKRLYNIEFGALQQK